MHLAFEVADEIVVMDRGVIVHHCETAQFRRDPGTAARLLRVDNGTTLPIAAHGVG